ncbi:MAG: hypothetical protein FWF03_04700 [Defluviitaleaceae bacterium]|nr:hypothetical protein [Defluviitaleaceae bacterium]
MNEKKLNEDCPCAYECKRHGDCEACRENHKGGLTSCQRIKKESEEG